MLGSRASMVFIPRPPPLPTFTTCALDAQTLLIFAKLDPEHPIRCWRVVAHADETVTSTPIMLTGCTTKLLPGFQAACMMHSATVVLLGGYNARTTSSQNLDVFVCRDVTPTVTQMQIVQLDCRGQSPSPRRNMTLIPSHTPTTLLVFGGHAVVRSTLGRHTRYRDSDGLYALDLAARRWSLVTGACIHGVCEHDPEATPGPRAGALSVWRGDTAWVIGGHRVGTEEGEAVDLRSQVYTLDLKTHQWRYIHTAGRTPDPRNLYDASALLCWGGHVHVISPRQSHRLDLTADPPMWSVLPGSLSTHGAPLLSHTWLQPGNAEASHDGQLGKVQRGIENGQQIKHHDTTVAYGIIRAPGPQSGEPSCLEDPGGLDWQPFIVHLHATDTQSCTGVAVYTQQQQPSADVLLGARARQDAAFLAWEDKQERAAHMQLQRARSRDKAHAALINNKNNENNDLNAEEEDPTTILQQRLPVKVLSFGEHHGALVWELPDAYVEWMSKEPGFFEQRRALLYSLKLLGRVQCFTTRDGKSHCIEQLESMASLESVMGVLQQQQG